MSKSTEGTTTIAMYQSQNQVPYHGAEPVNIAVRKIIFNTEEGTLLPMSVNTMIERLVHDGMAEGLAVKLASQIRKSGPLHFTWKAAFITKRFFQKTGRVKGGKYRRCCYDDDMQTLNEINFNSPPREGPSPLPSNVATIGSRRTVGEALGLLDNNKHVEGVSLLQGGGYIEPGQEVTTTTFKNPLLSTRNNNHFMNGVYHQPPRQAEEEIRQDCFYPAVPNRDVFYHRGYHTNTKQDLLVSMNYHNNNMSVQTIDDKSNNNGNGNSLRGSRYLNRSSSSTDDDCSSLQREGGGGGEEEDVISYQPSFQNMHNTAFTTVSRKRPCLQIDDEQVESKMRTCGE